MSNLKEPVNCGNNKLEFENCVSVGEVVLIEGGHIELEGIVIEGVFDDNTGENLSKTGGCHCRVTRRCCSFCCKVLAVVEFEEEMEGL